MQLGVICFSDSALSLCRRLIVSQQSFNLLCPGTDPAELAVHACATLPELLARLGSQKLIWLLEPDPPVLPVFDMLLEDLTAGDVIVDAGNTPFIEALSRQQRAATKGVAYIDVGIYLNPWGPQYGFALMVGGDKPALLQAAFSFDALAPMAQQGWLHCGPPGSGLFMRQLQRSVEQAVARSVSRAHQNFSNGGPQEISYQQIADLWQDGSELRQILQQQANDYLSRVDPDQPFAAFFEAPIGTSGVTHHAESWPAMELARIIQFAADGTHHFEQQILALLRTAPSDFSA